MFPGRFPNVPDTMWNFGWSPQTMGLQGQFCGGDMMNQQSQAQSQAQTQAQLVPLSGSKIRSSTNNSLLKLSPIYSTSSATPSFPSITSTNSSLSTHYKSPTATQRSPNITSPPSTTIPVPTSPIRIQETWQTAGLHSSQSSSSQIHTTNPSFTTSTIFL